MKKPLRLVILLLVLLQLAVTDSYAQGMTAFPVRNFLRIPGGESGTQRITVSNPTDSPLDIGISINDWQADSLGNPQIITAGTLKTSMADWLQIQPGTFISLQPRETRQITLVVTPPANADTSVPVHTALLLLTQLNPPEAANTQGAALRIAIRLGIKLYHSFSNTDEKAMEITGLKDIKIAKDSITTLPGLELEVVNTGRIWLEATTRWELVSSGTGKKTVIDGYEFTSLPGDTRIIRQELPATLEKGRYTATVLVNYGKKDELKVAELEFAL